MRNTPFALGLLMLLTIGSSASADTVECGSRPPSKLDSLQIERTGLMEALARFNEGIEKAQRHYRVEGKIVVLAMDCPADGVHVQTHTVLGGALAL